MEKVSDADTEPSLSRKMAPPLVTLLSAEPEIQYVELRNTSLFVQKRPSRRLSCSSASTTTRFMSRWRSSRSLFDSSQSATLNRFLLEFKEYMYATKVDVEFIRRSVHARAVKLERAAEKYI
ncbi:hypothetical protein V7S43_010267 [Phytophthora oleae]|uniref:Uncharacterized protein n=1 Tax=Phytophthora oleae TaxID=2107226 RepID=A0ABD3FC72_9STRA